MTELEKRFPHAAAGLPAHELRPHGEPDPEPPSLAARFPSLGIGAPPIEKALSPDPEPDAEPDPRPATSVQYHVVRSGGFRFKVYDDDRPPEAIELTNDRDPQTAVEYIVVKSGDYTFKVFDDDREPQLISEEEK